MQFFVPANWQNTTILTEDIPENFESYILTGARASLMLDGWGKVLSQEILRKEYIFNVHHFFINKDITLYPYTSFDILTFHVLLKGTIPCIIKGSGESNVLLETHIGQLFHIPGRIRHEAFFKAGMQAVSVHIDFSHDFLSKGAVNYNQLQILLSEAENESKKGHYQPAAALDARDLAIIEELPEELKKAGGPEFYLDAKVEDLLRWHLQKQQTINRQHLLDMAPFHFTDRELDGILYIKNLMEARLDKHYNMADFIKVTGLNADIIKKGFKHVTGMPLSVYRKKLCMEHARARVLQRKHSIQKIAGECGFNNVSHFIAEFKKYWGMTPGTLLENDA